MKINNPAMKILFIHGNSSSAKAVDKISSDEFQIIAKDLPGHGSQMYSNQPEKEYRFSALKEHVKSVAKQIDEPFILCGNSLGGHIVMEISEELEHCRALIVFGAPPLKKPLNTEEAFLPNDMLNAYLKADFTEEEIGNVIPFTVQNNECIPLLIEDFKNTDPKFRDVFALSALYDGEIDDEKMIIERLKIPVFLIHGMQDPSVNLAYLKSISNISKIYEIDNCGHYPTLEQPEIFTEILNEIVMELDH
ncbi:MAG: alpha/beta hydrolase [Reichenbachiella sp.]